MLRNVRTALRALLVVAVPLLTACSAPGQFVWYTDVPAEHGHAPGELVVHIGDTLSVRVLGHEDMGVKQKVRTDGRIAIPLIGEVEAQGKVPAALRAEIERRLKDYIVSPSVMVNLDEQQPLNVAVLGEVGKPGMYVLEPTAGLAQALAAAAGLTEFAQRDRIFVVRQRPKPARIRFTYEAVSRNDSGAAEFALRTGDVVVVE
jgi:polysaccharide export outer membrane protein